VQDNSGKLSGNGFANATEEGFDIALNFTLLGSVKGKDNITTVKLTMKITGTASDGFQVIPVSGNLKFNFAVDNASSQLLGAVKGKICVQGLGCAPIDEAAQFAIPEGSDGDWTLVMDIDSLDGKALAGTGAAVLSNGRALPVALSGKYASTSDTSKVTLKGDGAKLTLQGNATPGVFAIHTLKAKLLGQRLSQ
ncbi:MAG TPA: hypothetical protein VNL14_16950, partial [Candidatus Acidoferrales bacterium]|nr:hypothetical protein [Candidatus Acidoferrales bacterium]